MKLLVDSHALIWYVDQDHLLSPVAHAAITDPTNEVGEQRADIRVHEIAGAPASDLRRTASRRTTGRWNVDRTRSSR